MEPNGNGKHSTSDFIPQPHGGALRPGGKIGNKGGPGRPRKELRRRMRDLLYMSQSEINARLRAERARVRKDELTIEKLRRKTKKQLLQLIEDKQLVPPSALKFEELRSLLDTAAKYGIGSRNVLEVEADEDGMGHGIVLMPAITRIPDD